MFNTRYILIFIFSIFYMAKTYGQYSMENFRKYTTKQGLASNHITGIIQDTFGYLWVGTQNGLQRFDGLEFENIKMPVHSQAANIIYQLNALKGNEIGVCTQHGAYIFSTIGGNTKSLEFIVDDDFKYWAYAIKGIGKDRKGNFGVSSGTGFYVFDPDGKLLKKFEPFTKEAIGSQWLRYGRNVHTMVDGQMLQENEKGLAIYKYELDSIFNLNRYKCMTDISNANNIRYGFLNDSLMYYFPTTSKIVIFNAKTCQSFEWTMRNKKTRHFTWFSRLTILNDTTIIINGYDGIYTMKPDYTKFKFEISEKLNLEGNQFLSCLKTKDGKIILGTKDGLFVEKNKEKVIFSFKISDTIAKNLIINHIRATGENIYVSSEGNGLFVLDKKTKMIQNKIDFKKLGLAYNVVNFTWQYTNDTFWISTAAGMLWFHTKTKAYGKLQFDGCKDCLQKIDVNDIYKDSKGEYWFGSNVSNYIVHTIGHKASLIRQDKDNPLLKVTSIIYFSEDPQGNMWFSSDAIARWNRNTGKVDSLIQRVQGQNSFLRGYGVYFDIDGNTWYVIAGEGLIIENQSGERIRLFQKQLIPKRGSKQFSVHNNHMVYINTQNQLVVLNMKNRQHRTYTTINGLDETAVSSLFSFDKDENKILFAVKNIAYEIGLDFPVNVIENKIIIKKITSANMKPIMFPSGNVILENKNRSFMLDFGMINFEDPENLQYSYRLIPSVDTSWIELNLPHVQFSELASGKYNVELKVESKNNFRLPVVSIFKITIKPPFYYTWWFLSLVFSLVVLTSAYFIKMRFHKIKKLSQLDKAIAEYEMKALHAQMNPHFVFNCLNSIKEMIISKESENASKYLSKFAKMMRATIDQSKNNWTTLQENIDYLDTYLEMESIRFENFIYTVTVENIADRSEILMAPMLLQPLVENAIWHGLMKISGEKLLHIKISKVNEYIICIVDDNGIGYQNSIKLPNVHHGIGLNNIQQRIEIINQKYHLDYSLTITDKSTFGQSGTLAVVKFLSK